MNDTNKDIKPFCRYCDKLLSEAKGELAHGCLHCHGSVWVERIDYAESVIKKLKAQNEKLLECVKRIADRDTAIVISDGISSKYNNYEQGWHGVAEYAGNILKELGM